MSDSHYTDLDMLLYFWEAKDDIERYAGWVSIQPMLAANYPEIIKAWSDYKAARAIVGAVLRDACDRASSGESDGR